MLDQGTQGPRALRTVALQLLWGKCSYRNSELSPNLLLCLVLLFNAYRRCYSHILDNVVSHFPLTLESSALLLTKTRLTDIK